jgi:3-hydroxyisobutyrate dehydrogenase-like beta-hydroxyacid dehydrogenase
MVYASKAGIDNSTILDILAGSALNAPTFQVKGKQIIDRAFAPRFFAENLLKDTNLMIDHAALLGAQVPVAHTVREMLERTITMGAAKEDYIAMIKSIE